MTLSHAMVSWNTDGEPFSEKFGDIYFSKNRGIEESTHVFLNGNNLPERFKEHSGEIFSVGELGFGTGLNFLLTWKTYLALSPPDMSMVYSSIEGYPLSFADMERSLEKFSSLFPESEELLNVYSAIREGKNIFRFSAGRITLMLFVGEVAKILSEIPPGINAWFMDGFSPQKNQDMWSIEICQSIQSLSDIGATVATYTESNYVRRNLESSGFKMSKIPGFGGKRAMLAGELVNQLCSE